MVDLFHLDFSQLGIDAAQTDEVRKLFRPRRLTRGTWWITPGTVCRRLSFVAEGMLRAYVGQEGEEQTRWVFLPGTYVTSLMSFGKQHPSEEYIQAITDVQLYEISHADWTALCQRYPGVQQAWADTLLDLYGCFESRVHSLLMGRAEDRYAYFMKRYPEFILHVPQKYVAEMLGIAPRHLSRIRSGYERA